MRRDLVYETILHQRLYGARSGKFPIPARPAQGSCPPQWTEQNWPDFTASKIHKPQEILERCADQSGLALGNLLSQLRLEPT